MLMNISFCIDWNVKKKRPYFILTLICCWFVYNSDLIFKDVKRMKNSPTAFPNRLAKLHAIISINKSRLVLETVRQVANVLRLTFDMWKLVIVSSLTIVTVTDKTNNNNNINHHFIIAINFLAGVLAH